MRPKDCLDGNPVSLQIVGETAVISVDNPPVNAISHAVRAGLVEDQAIQAVAQADQAVVLASQAIQADQGWVE